MQYKLNIAQHTWDIDKLYELEKNCLNRLMEKRNANNNNETK